AWTAAHDLLTAADRVEPLGAADLDRLAVAAYLIGRDDASVDGWARAFRASVHSGDVAEAARHGFWAGFTLLLRGRTAQAGGWLARANRLIADGDPDCVARGLLMIPVGLDRMEEGDIAGAHRAFAEASGIGARFGDPDLVALATLGRGQALL